MFGIVLDAIKEVSDQSFSVNGNENKGRECDSKSNKEEQEALLSMITVNTFSIQPLQLSVDITQTDQPIIENPERTAFSQKKAEQIVNLSFKGESETFMTQKGETESIEPSHELMQDIFKNKTEPANTTVTPKKENVSAENVKQYSDFSKKIEISEKKADIFKKAEGQAVEYEPEIEKTQTVFSVKSETTESNVLPLKISKQIVSQEPKTEEKAEQTGVLGMHLTKNRTSDHISVQKQKTNGLSDVNFDEVVSRMAGPIKKEALSGTDTSFKIKLRPEGLGEVTVDLKHSGENLSISIKTELSSTKDLIETGLDNLKRALSNTTGQNRLSVSSLTVENRSASFGSAFMESRSNNSGSFSHSDRNSARYNADASERFDTVTEVKGTQQNYSKAYRSGTLDYRA